MTESKKQRLERIAVAMAAAIRSSQTADRYGAETVAKAAIGQAQALIAALDTLPPDA